MGAPWQTSRSIPGSDAPTAKMLRTELFLAINIISEVVYNASEGTAVCTGCGTVLEAENEESKGQ